MSLTRVRKGRDNTQAIANSHVGAALYGPRDTATGAVTGIGFVGVKVLRDVSVMAVFQYTTLVRALRVWGWTERHQSPIATSNSRLFGYEGPRRILGP
jgi:hypothetical protein